MSTERRPWYKWYPKDFVVDEKVQGLSDDAELLYRRLLDILWQANALQLPNNCLKLANQIARGWTKERFENAWNDIQTPGFELLKTSSDGNWIYSSRLKEEAEKVEIISKIRSNNGRKAKAKQKPSKSQASAPYTDTDTDNNTCAKNCACEICFNRFWEMYGKKRDRKKCLTKWKNLKQSDRDKIFKTLPAYVASTQDTQYRKDPATYLNNHSWENDIVKPGQPINNAYQQVPRSEIINYDENGNRI